MSEFRVGIIGCGRPRNTDGATGFGMSHWHARGYEESPDCRIVALADISEENARAFQAEHGGDHLYTDYQEMLARENLDIVSICTWPHLHAPMVIAAAEAGVRAIHCEKPMAPTWGEARRMVETCERHGAQLTFNHQRRFAAPFRQARELLRAGAIGPLQRLEMRCIDLFDWGTHWFDMCHFYNDETPAAWVLGQVDLRDGRTVFGIPLEGQGLSHIKFANDVHALVVTGPDHGWTAQNRLVGAEGVIEVGVQDGPPVRVWGWGQSGWTALDTPADSPALAVVARGVLDLVDALKTGREPELAGRRALRATELSFATYESSRRRGRVDLPLDIDDSPLAALQAEAAEGARAH
ncbi:MAG: Gfo/Idh/MocA family protein [Thermomicrobiales bacterium]